mmetsp:Transcript_5264/g.16925  ORF Transcript_5264/g.16925 Transcript_5264/m.16925 type:complete len:210 (-) Transcript_5264:1880-2509(-)
MRYRSRATATRDELGLSDTPLEPMPMWEPPPPAAGGGVSRPLLLVGAESTLALDDDDRDRRSVDTSEPNRTPDPPPPVTADPGRIAEPTVPAPSPPPPTSPPSPSLPPSPVALTSSARSVSSSADVSAPRGGRISSLRMYGVSAVTKSACRTVSLSTKDSCSDPLTGVAVSHGRACRRYQMGALSPPARAPPSSPCTAFRTTSDSAKST